MGKFRALLKYELLWNLRKKKLQALLLIVIVIQIITYVIPYLLSYSSGQEIMPDPYMALSSPPGFFIFLFVIAVSMNSISEEFEQGRAHILFSKPVSRTLIFLVKIISAIIILTIVFIILHSIGIVLSYFVYGTQEYLIYSPVLILGILIASLIYLSIVFFLGSASKSSIIAALGSFGILIGLGITVGILGTFGGYAWIADYVPSGGQEGVIMDVFPPISISTGTDNMGKILSYLTINPSFQINIAYVSGIDINQIPPVIEFQSQIDSIQNVFIKALGVTLAYSLSLLLISWFIFRRSEIKE